MSCSNLYKCIKKAERKYNSFKRSQKIADKIHDEFREKLIEGEATLVASFHSHQRLVDRLYSNRDIASTVENGWVISASQNDKGRRLLTLMSYVSVGSRTYRPIHIVIEVVEPSVWKVITVMDPSERPWKWNESYEKQICFCEFSMK
ncbi:DUF4258 domain-containing protein [Paenibacillus thiaminolyticus]